MRAMNATRCMVGASERAVDRLDMPRAASAEPNSAGAHALVVHQP